MIVCLILAVMAMGAVFASDDAAIDDGLEDGNITDDSIGQTPVDDDVGQSEDLKPALEADSAGFNASISDSVDLANDYDVIANYTVPDDAEGSLYLYFNGKECYYTPISGAESDEITVFDLYEDSISQPGTYNVLVSFISDGGDNLTLASKTLKVTRSYVESDFNINFNEKVYSRWDYAVNLWDFPVEGTFTVSVNGYPRFSRYINDLKEDWLVYLLDLGISSNGTFNVSAKYIVNSTSQAVDLGWKNVTADLDWSGDDYIGIEHNADILNIADDFIFIKGYRDYLNGAVSVYIDGNLRMSEKILSSEAKREFYINIDDLDLFDNIGLGNHAVRVVYMKDNAERHELQSTVTFYACPLFTNPFVISVGEKDSFIVTYVRGFGGTAALLRDDENRTVFKTAGFANGVATFYFDSLTEGNYTFILDVPGCAVQPPVSVSVRKNTPGYSASVSPSTITEGSDIVVKFSGPYSFQNAFIYVDDEEYGSILLDGGVSSEIIEDLPVGTHKIKVKFEDEDKFYSNTFYVTVKAPDKIKLTLKKVKVKRSAKKLVLQATLKINGKAAKGKVIKFKFNKKTYKAKTNRKGVAKITIKKKVLKKLKVGKKVKYQASYAKVTKKYTVKVKK